MNHVGTTRGQPSSSTVAMRTRCPGSSRNPRTSSSVILGIRYLQSEEIPVARAGAHLLSSLLEDDATRTHHVDPIGDAQGLTDVLLEQEHGEPLSVGELSH